MMLRGSKTKGDLDYDKVRAMAQEGLVRDEDGYRSEMVRLIDSSPIPLGKICNWAAWNGRIRGMKLHVVYDPVGGAYSEAALRATAWRGRFLVVGFAAGEIPKLALNLALLKERDILGVFWGDAVRRDPAQHAANMRLLAEWFAAGKVRPTITERVSLDGAADAIARMANRQVKGKVVILPDA